MTTRRIKASGKYLLLPLADQKGWFPAPGTIQYLGLYQNGRLLEEYELSLSEKPRAWGVLYLERYAGQELELRLEGGEERLLELLEVSDRTRDAALYQEPERPLAHFTPMRGFMNDPNGLFYHRGEYHYFAQLNPYGFSTGNTHWLHAVSRDLIHWRELPYALLPDETGRMYSGGGVVDVDNTSGLGVGGEPPIFLFYTPAGSKTRWSRGRSFEIAVAVSTDGGRSFEKYPGNPIVPNLSFMNRDPKVVWTGECWAMAIFLDNDRYMILYSDDLLHWEQGDELHIRGAAECPDLFALPLEGDPGQVKWVLWGSTDSYLVGRFHGRHFVPETDAVQGPSHRAYSAYSDSLRSPGGYAAQTFTGAPEGRVVQIAWVRVCPKSGPFVSCASLPVELTLRATEEGPRLFQQPIQEVGALYENTFEFKNRGLEEIERIPSQYLGEAMDIRFRFTVKPGKLIAISVRGMLIVYDPNTGRLLLPVGAYDIGPVGEELDLRVVTDRCSVEVFANEGRFGMAIAAILDPNDISLRPVYLEAGIGIDLELHRLGNMWSEEVTAGS